MMVGESSHGIWAEQGQDTGLKHHFLVLQIGNFKSRMGQRLTKMQWQKWKEVSQLYNDHFILS